MKKQKNKECKLCKSAHPLCDMCCKECEIRCNAKQVCRLEPVKKWGPDSMADIEMVEDKGGGMTEVQVVGEGVLTKGEKSRLEELCGVVDRGIKGFFEVGMALGEIRGSRLYRENHETFEDFCRDRWDIGKSHSYRFIEAAQVLKNLSPIGDNTSSSTLIIPANEAQARPLTLFEADVQRDIWQIVLDRAIENNGKITATLVSSVVAEYLRKSVREKLDDRKTRISRENLIEPIFKETFQTFVNVVSETINNGFKGTSREAVLRHLDAVRELVAHTKG